MSHDTLIHRAIRPAVRRLGPTALRPNHLTALRLATALAAAGCFATGRTDALYAGCVLFTGSALLDRADGELARQTRRFSRWGHWLDLAGDCAADALAFLGLGYGLGGAGPLALGALAAAGVMGLFWQLNRGGTAGRPVRRPLDPDDAILLVPLLLASVGAWPVLAMAGTVTPVVALYAWWRGLTL